MSNKNDRKLSPDYDPHALVFGAGSVFTTARMLVTGEELTLIKVLQLALDTAFIFTSSVAEELETLVMLCLVLPMSNIMNNIVKCLGDCTKTTEYPKSLSVNMFTGKVSWSVRCVAVVNIAANIVIPNVNTGTDAK